MNKLTVNLVAWNGEKYIPFLFESLKKQTYKDFRMQILDNGSKDKTVEKIELALQGSGLESNLIKGETNLGFVGGHNLLYKQTNSEFVLLLNQDIYLMPDCIEKIIYFIEAHADVGAVTPRLMKWNFSEIKEKGLQSSFSETPDSLGLEIYRNRRAAEINEQSNQSEKEIFGVSGALPLFRMSVLVEAQFENGNIFDELYHSYKEDADLAFRLFGLGWKSFLVNNAVAYHDRSTSGPKDQTHFNLIKNNKRQSEWAKYHSYKNHLMTIYKNEFRENFMIDFFHILWYEFRKFIYYLIFDPKVLKGLSEIAHNWRELNEKRAFIMRSKNVKWFELRKWIK